MGNLFSIVSEPIKTSQNNGEVNICYIAFIRKLLAEHKYELKRYEPSDLNRLNILKNVFQDK